MAKYLKESTLEEATADDKENEIIDQLISDYEQIINEIKKDGLSLSTELGDEPSSDLLITIQGKLEKYVWMLKSYRAYE